MKEWKEFESNTIRIISEQLKGVGFEISLNSQLDQDVEVLISGLPLLGEIKRQLNLEMCFLPIEENNRNNMKYNYLQFFVAIQNDISNSVQKNLIELVNTLNASLPIGALGVISKDKLLYYRYCCVFTQNMTEENIKAVVDANVTMIITLLNVYIDILADIADGNINGDGILGSKMDN